MTSQDSVPSSDPFRAIVARVVELNRGPQPLLQWVRARVDSQDRNDSQDSKILRLANELAQLIRLRTSLTQTANPCTSATVTR